MPSIARPILLAVYASFFLALTDFSPATIGALAAPLPNHSSALATNSPSSLLAVRVVTKHTSSELIARIPTTVSPVVVSPAASLNRRQSFETISTSADKASKAAARMKALAEQSQSADPNDKAFQEECVSGLNDYSTSFGEFQTAVVPFLRSDDGLANYDKTNQLEGYIKILVNAHKDILSSTATLVDNVPLLGPTLGPIVYQIKCIIDIILDATEDVTDGLINQLAPLLQQLGLGSLIPLLQGLGLLGTVL